MRGRGVGLGAQVDVAVARRVCVGLGIVNVGLERVVVFEVGHGGWTAVYVGETDELRAAAQRATVYSGSSILRRSHVIILSGAIKLNKSDSIANNRKARHNVHKNKTAIDYITK